MSCEQSRVRGDQRSLGAPIAALALAAIGAAGCSSSGEATAERVADDAAPIIGGTDDYGHDYVVGVGNNLSSWCSATLISRQTVITAAHCANGITRVYFGKFLQSSVAADMEVVHPEWTGEVPSADVALVRLTEPSDVQPAPLLRDTLDDSARFIGPDFTFVGFGVTDAMSHQGGQAKRQVALPITAIGPTTTVDGIPVSERFFYYEHSTKNTCFGDSGGPTFFIDGGVESHAGVTSWGDQNCSQYGVQARSDQPTIDLWIQSIVELFEGPHACSNDGVCEESCNVGGNVMDPDCQAAHCGPDGVCARACVDPVDEDCPEIYDPCGEDDNCNEGCVPADPDCAMTAATTSIGVVTAIVSATTSTSSAAGGAGGGASGADQPSGGCAVAPRDVAPAADDAWWLALLALLGLGRRRRFSRRGE